MKKKNYWNQRVQKKNKKIVCKEAYDVWFFKNACESSCESGRTMSIKGLELLHEDLWERTKHGQQNLDDTCFKFVAKWKTAVVNKSSNSKVVPISLFPKSMIKVSFECSNLQTSIEMVLIESFFRRQQEFLWLSYFKP